MRFLAPLSVIALLIGAASLGMRGADAPADFRFKDRGSVHTLDPASMSYMQDMRVAEGVWEGLMRHHPKTSEAIPGVAISQPEISADGKRYLFTIRSDARWSNGDPVTARDFIRGWRRAIEPGSAETYAYIIQDFMEGAGAYVAWRAQWVGVLGLIRQLQKGEPIETSDARKALIGEAGAALRKLLKTPLPDPAPEEADKCWARAIDELKTSGAEFERLGDELLGEHWYEMERRFEKVGMHALDDHHLEIRLNLPTAFFRDLTTFSTYSPIHVSIEKLRDSYRSKIYDSTIINVPLTSSGLWTYDPQWTKPDYHRNDYPGLVCNGAYRLAKWRFRQYVRLEANPYYWNKDNVGCKSIDILDIDYDNAAFMLYEQERIDWVLELSMDYTPELVRQQQQKHRDDIHLIPSFGTYYVTINCAPRLLDGRPNVLADPRVRRAVTMAIDRQSIVDNIERLGNSITTTFVPVNQVPGYVSPQGLGFDLKQAREELVAAGYAKGQGLPVIELLYNTNQGHESKMQALARMWEQNLGMRIQLVPKEGKAFAEDKDKGRFMLGRGGWFGDYNDPTTFLDMFQSQNGNNVGKYKDERYDALLAQAAREVEPAKRMKILSDAEGYLMTQGLPIVPLFGYVVVHSWRQEVSGIHPNPLTLFPLQYIRKVRGEK